MSKLTTILFFLLALISYKGLATSFSHEVSLGDTSLLQLKQQGVDKMALSLSPNPTQDFVNITYHFSSKMKVEIKLEDAEGQELLADILEANEEGDAKLQLDVRDFKAGRYYIIINAATNPLKMEFVKE